MLRYFPLLFLPLFPAIAQPPTSPNPLTRLMPHAADTTSMWWRDGFPGVVNNADWRRIVKTGHYWFMQDTDTMGIARLGAAGPDNRGPVQKVDGAKLELDIMIGDAVYRCRNGGDWSRFSGPRLISSGRFLQRADVNHLEFSSDDGRLLNVEARFETTAWPDQLGLLFAARPGYREIVAGEQSFGRIHGGFGLDGTNRLDVSAKEAATTPEFTMCFWAYVPRDFHAGKHVAWLMCKNAHESVNGHYGIMLNRDGRPEARLNIGGGAVNGHRAIARNALKLEAWHHLAISYDGKQLRLFVNGQPADQKAVNKVRSPEAGGLAFGNRQGNKKDPKYYAFRGIIDEIHRFDRALPAGQIFYAFHKPQAIRDLRPQRSWAFRSEGQNALERPREAWSSAVMRLRIRQGDQTLTSITPLTLSGDSTRWNHAAIMLDPTTFKRLPESSPIGVRVREWKTNTPCPSRFDAELGAHRINLDQVAPIPPNKRSGSSNETTDPNDHMERVRLHLVNPLPAEQIARLVFEKTSFRHRHGFPITGLSAILRDAEGRPTGIPIQLSKNWHFHPKETGPHSGQWFHGITQIRLPANSAIDLELSVIYGHWGGLPAASHAQLSLIGWGGNQRWDQSAIGSWGESICFDPEQAQANCTVTDVRPLMVTGVNPRKPKWGWTVNVGGADAFRFFDPEGERVPHTAMQTTYHRQGPCLTEVTYDGSIGRTGIHQRQTVSLSRRDDLTLGTFRLQLRVNKPAKFSRFVIFQTGADTYSNGSVNKMALGKADGLTREWDTQAGGDTYRGSPTEARGPIPWASLHEGIRAPGQRDGAWANRGVIIRKWSAILGGKPAQPWFAERGLDRGPHQTSTLDLLPPPGLARLEVGDRIDAVIEFVVVPQSADDYYGPNIALRHALRAHGNGWQLIHRQAVGDHRKVKAQTGVLQYLYPDIRLTASQNQAAFTLQGGLGFVPVTIQGLNAPNDYTLAIDDKALDQSIHGNDFWQTDYDATSKTWSRTYNIPGSNKIQHIKLEHHP